MKLSEVPIEEIVETVRVPELIEGGEDRRGRWRWKSETRVTRLYDFGSFKRGGRVHEKNVLMHLKEFACDKHDQFTPDCSACVEFVTSKAGPINHLRESRGIEVTAE